MIIMRPIYNSEYYIHKKFGKWTVLNYKGVINKQRVFECQCECGIIQDVRFSHMIKGHGCRSCACIKHGLTNTKLHKVWKKMIERCKYSTDTNYKNYGGRGIKVCDEWNNSFTAFYEWAIQNGYNENHKHGECTLDRIDVNGNYEPNNCRWVDMHIQLANRRKCKINTSGYTGVIKYTYPSGKTVWKAVICVRGNKISLGLYATKKEAVEARNKYIIDNNLIEYPIQEWKDE